METSSVFLKHICLGNLRENKAVRCQSRGYLKENVTGPVQSSLTRAQGMKHAGRTTKDKHRVLGSSRVCTLALNTEDPMADNC